MVPDCNVTGATFESSAYWYVFLCAPSVQQQTVNVFGSWEKAGRVIAEGNSSSKE